MAEQQSEEHLKKLCEHVCTFDVKNDKCLKYVKNNIDEIRKKMIEHIDGEVLFCDSLNSE